MLQGKGFFVWQVDQLLKNMETQDVKVAVRRAKAADIQHVMVKIADGAGAFPIPDRDRNGRKETQTAVFIK